MDWIEEQGIGIEFVGRIFWLELMEKACTKESIGVN